MDDYDLTPTFTIENPGVERTPPPITSNLRPFRNGTEIEKALRNRLTTVIVVGIEGIMMYPLYNEATRLQAGRAILTAGDPEDGVTILVAWPGTQRQDVFTLGRAWRNRAAGLLGWRQRSAEWEVTDIDGNQWVTR